MRKVNFIIIISLICIFVLPVFSQRIINFEEALQTARSNSPEIKQVKLRYERSRELLNAQKAALKSQFSLNLEPFYYYKNREFDNFASQWYTNEIKRSTGTFSISQPLIWTDGTISLQDRFRWQDSYNIQGNRELTNTAYTNDLFIEYLQPIFTYNRTKMEFQEVELDMEDAYLNYQIQDLMLEQRTAGYFYDVYQKKMSLQVAREELQNTDQNYQVVENKVNAGLLAREELYQAELNLANSRSAVYNAEAAYENSLDQFKQTLGISLFEDVTVVADVSETIVNTDLQKAIDYGLKYRMELRQRRIELDISRNNITRASANNEFKGNVSLRYGILGDSEKFKDIYNKQTQSQEVSLRLEIPLYDWGQKESRIKAAEASFKSSEISAEEQKKDIIIEIRQAYRSLQNQKLQMEIARQNVKVAKLTYDINLERYLNGDLTSMDLNLFQNQLSEKKINQVDAIISHKLALLDLKIRSLWDFEKNRPVLKDLKAERE